MAQLLKSLNKSKESILSQGVRNIGVHGGPKSSGHFQTSDVETRVGARSFKSEMSSSCEYHNGRAQNNIFKTVRLPLN